MLVDTTDDGVCTITLHNRDRRNAWNPTMESQYFAALDAAAAGPVWLRLEGRRSQHHPLTIPKPMVAAINGSCAGIGLVQALVCDVRFMARGARLSAR